VTMMRLLVRLLLRLFPAWFRRNFGAAMLATFDDQWRENASPALAWRTIAGLLRTAFLLWGRLLTCGGLAIRLPPVDTQPRPSEKLRHPLRPAAIRASAARWDTATPDASSIQSAV